MEGEDKLFAGASHLAIFFNLVGFLAVVVLYLSKKKTSSFVAEHAKQAMGYQIVVYLLGMVIGATIMASFAGGFGLLHSRGIWVSPQAGLWSLGGMSLLFGLAQFAVLGYAMIGAIHGFTGKPFRYWIIGDKIAELDK
ncbi:putative Tic20 family protein [Desulfitispora alkaliphila]|uniref:DUF4870 domain-containing protein n=1 Tax=Desulfitispora alkaliphila TaxID=622674 RepID=UPI003D23FB34